MSAEGDRTFVGRVRDDLERAIEQQTAILITTTTERRAGYVQGLQDALVIINNLVKAAEDNRNR